MVTKAKHKKAEEEVEVEEEETVEAEIETKPEKGTKHGSDSVDVIKGIIYVRTYSREIHGDDFLKLAEQLISKPEYAKRTYVVVPSEQNPVVAVLYNEREDFDVPLDQRKKDQDVKMVDKERQFTDKTAALAFNIQKKGSVVIVKGGKIKAPKK